METELPYCVTSLVTDEAPNLRIKDVMMCCTDRAITILREW
jgi:hypothetical protein